MFLQEKPNYEKLGVGMLLAGSAGSLDAYTYLTHGGIFAAFQSGNILKLSMSLGQGHFQTSLRYLFSVLMFVLGTIIMRLFQHKYDNEKRVSRSTLIILYEILLLIVVFIIGRHISNLLSVSILTFSAAAQLQEFRVLEGHPYNSLMMTNNLRTITESFYDSKVKKDAKAKEKGRKIFLILIGFMAGAALNGFLVPRIGTFTIFVSILLLIFAIIFSHVAVRHVIDPTTKISGE